MLTIFEDATVKAFDKKIPFSEVINLSTAPSEETVHAPEPSSPQVVAVPE
jgi:hypothetical protein